MYILIQIALLALCCSMFKLSREYKVAVLLLASICFESVILERVPFGQAKYVLSHCFILSELPYIAKHIRSLKRTVLYSLMSIAIVAAVILLVNSPHFNNNLKDILRLFILELTGKYFALCYAFVSIISMDRMRPVLKVSYYGLLVLTLFGLMNLLTRRALFIDAIGSHMNVAENFQDLGATFMYSDRFRVQAMFFNPFNYGYICCLLMFLQLWGYLKGMVARRRFLICMACCMLGILSCGCRTIIFCWLIGILTFIHYSFPVKRWFKYVVIGVFVGIMVYSVIPAVQDKVSQTMTIFDPESRNVGGSSINMRLLQYATVLHHINGHELFGRGYGYFNIDLGWGDGIVDEELYGLEGVVMSYLLERGIVGLLLYISFYTALLVFLYRHRQSDFRTFALAVSAVFVYLVFANMTGELSSVFPTMLIVGCCLRMLTGNKNTELYPKQIQS